MASKTSNRNLQAAKAAKGDEFYTQLADIERELKHYRKHFVGKVVYCNCDDPRVSNFFHYFSYSFEKLGLKKLITTCYKSQRPNFFSQNDSEQAIYLEYDGDKNQNMIPDPKEIGIKHLKGDGDFRSAETIELLKQADIVVTNPPFSLFREYVAQLMEYEKKFVIVGNKNAVKYKEIFPYIQENRMWVGYTPMGKETVFGVPEELGHQLVASGRDRSYTVVDGVVMGRAQACWFTNLDITKRHEDQVLYKTYNPGEYPPYANFDGIEVGRTEHIPMDYAGVMGVPISFLDKYNPDQFEILGTSLELAKPMSGIAAKGTYPPGGPNFYLSNGDGTYRRTYERLAIRNRRI